MRIPLFTRGTPEARAGGTAIRRKGERGMRYEQASLLDLLTLTPEKEDLQESEHSRVIRRTDGVYEIHGLVYSLELIDGWVEVKNLWAMRPPKIVAVIAERAWVRPDTIEVVHKNRYNKAWGFGPKIQISKREYEIAVFDFVNYEDVKNKPSLGQKAEN